MKVQWFKVHAKARSRLSLTHLPVQPLSRVKSWDGQRVRVVSPVVKEKVYGGKDLLKSQVLSSEWNTEQVRQDASGDSEDGEDDELPCVIGERAGDCVWRGSRRSVGSSFHRQVAAYRPKGAICDFHRGVGRWVSKSDHRWRTCVVTWLNRDPVVEILRLVGCENVIS